MVEELDFSEEACIERYVSYAYFDDADEHLHIEGIEDDDPVISGLDTYGRITADWDGYEIRKKAEAVGQMDQLRLAA